MSTPILTNEERAMTPVEFLRSLATYGADPRIYAYVSEYDRAATECDELIGVELPRDEARALAQGTSGHAADRGAARLRAALDGPHPDMGSAEHPGGLQAP